MRNLLITGVTGFVAKAIVERLLADEVPQQLFLHVRAASDEDARDRVRDALRAPLFDERRRHGADPVDLVGKTIIPLRGDISGPLLGLDDSALAALPARLDAVIHVAGDTRFGAPLDELARANILGAKGALALAKERGAPLLHMSTAYVNAHVVGPVPEAPLAPLPDLRRAIAGALAGDAERNGFADAYTYSKALAELLLADERGEHPVHIIRPTTVEAAWRGGLPGWLEGCRMLEPLILGIATGELRAFPFPPELPHDIVPVDLVAEVTCAALGTTIEDTELRVSHAATAARLPLTTGALTAHVIEHFARAPLQRDGALLEPSRTVRALPDADTIAAWRDAAQASLQDESLPDARRRALRRRWRRFGALHRTAALYQPYAFCRARFASAYAPAWIARTSFSWDRYLHEAYLPGVARWVHRDAGSSRDGTTARQAA